MNELKLSTDKLLYNHIWNGKLEWEVLFIFNSARKHYLNTSHGISPMQRIKKSTSNESFAVTFYKFLQRIKLFEDCLLREKSIKGEKALEL